MTDPLIIFGSSTATTGHDLPASSDATFTWLHLEGTSYLRMQNGTPTDASDIVVTVVGVADSSTASTSWLLLA